MFSLDKKSVVLRYKECQVQVFPDGTMQWYDEPAESDFVTCLGFYQGEVKN